MANTPPIYVYDKDCTDYANTGLVGDLQPIQAVFTEEKNGISEIELKLTYDQYNKWRQAQVGNIIKCKVPVRVPPVIENDEYANSTDIGE